MKYAVLKADNVTWREVADSSEVNEEIEFFSAQAYAVRNDRLGYFAVAHPSECPSGHHAEFVYPNGTAEMQERSKADGRDGKMREFLPRKDDLASKLARIAIKSIGEGVAVGQPLVMTALAREALDNLHQIEGIPQRPAVKAAKSSGTPENLFAVLNTEYASVVASASPALKTAVKYTEIGL